jgi:hypothetical protein
VAVYDAVFTGHQPCQSGVGVQRFCFHHQGVLTFTWHSSARTIDNQSYVETRKLELRGGSQLITLQTREQKNFNLWDPLPCKDL